MFALKIRIGFEKHGSMKYVGHLDFMRFFQKCMRLAKIDIAYSGGFSPHQIMSFASPLGVGVTSDGDYLDIEVNSSGTSEESIAALNRIMVDGIKVISYRKLAETDQKAMAAVTAASYRLTYKNQSSIPDAGILTEMSELLNRDVLMITKKTKKSEREVNLRPLIYQFSVSEEDGQNGFNLTVSTGSTDNVKPELVLEAMYLSLGQVFLPDCFMVHRLDTFTSIGNSLISLNRIGEEIE
ncbi:MAG: TIGR03936 family radical SAM-associated protein [Lachnospiraceae bacterium]